jgi:cytidylate kinase
VLSRRMSACYTRLLMNGTIDAQRRLVIAIDGPSGAGKGTIARAVARQLGYRHVDTGAMYRAIAWLARDRQVHTGEEGAIAALAESARLDVGERVVIDGHDVTAAIRTPEMDRAAAEVARMPGVRRVLVARQHALGEGGGIVMEGRDIGTVVFPAADVKIYLDADPAERARRRAGDPAHSGGRTALADLASAMADRDRTDATRTASPLVIAPDAIHVDTTGVPVEDVVRTVLSVVERASRG